MTLRKHLIIFIALLLTTAAFAQSAAVDSSGGRKVLRRDIGVVKKVTVYPYLTLSGNFQSGQAFPKSANGIGYGFGLAFDLTEDKQPYGLYFDLAYQDMRASAKDGGAKVINPAVDSVAMSVPVEHYFSYALFEAFVKLQGEKSNGYFLLGASVGFATLSQTVWRGPGSVQVADWSAATNSQGNTIGNSFRFDIRAGLGVKLATIAGYPLVFEARFGYPVTAAITDYNDFANGNSSHGPWRVLSFQGNLGLRF